MSKKIKIPKKTIGYGYMGVWKSGDVGWFAPKHIGASKRSPDNPDLENENLAGERLFLCKITAVPIKDKLGRPITKLVPKSPKK